MEAYYGAGEFCVNSMKPENIVINQAAHLRLKSRQAAGCTTIHQQTHFNLTSTKHKAVDSILYTMPALKCEPHNIYILFPVSTVDAS